MSHLCKYRSGFAFPSSLRYIDATKPLLIMALARSSHFLNLHKRVECLKDRLSARLFQTAISFFLALSISLDANPPGILRSLSVIEYTGALHCHI